MERKKLVLLCMGVGSYVGSYLPSLWGSSMFSFSSVFLAALGGFAGIYIGYRFGE